MYRASGRSRRHGFTLVELLVAIAIIGVLASLTSVAVFAALRSARQKAVLLEVDQLTTAMHSYKEQAGRYPPCMGGLSTTIASPFRNRQQRLEQHIRVAYPRYSRNYAQLQTSIGVYNYQNAMGSTSPLNFDTLDPAEALVFWLGGPPTPVGSSGNPVIARKLFGFHNDALNPFRLDTAGDQTKFRMLPLFQFDESRLVDQDDDGWLEYTPRGMGATTGGHSAPYVYFDADLYTSLNLKSDTLPYSGYPPTKGVPQSPGSDALMQEFGSCVPYAASVSSSASDPIRWVNPDNFQVISAGLDSMYGPVDEDVRLPVFPAGTTWNGTGFGQTGFFDQAEGDNLGNFYDGPLEDGVTGT